MQFALAFNIHTAYIAPLVKLVELIKLIKLVLSLDFSRCALG